MSAIPDFILRKVIVPSSLKPIPTGYIFDLNNNLAPATIESVWLEVDGLSIPIDDISIHPEGGISRAAITLNPESPCPLPVGTRLHVRVSGSHPFPQNSIIFHNLTREMGKLTFPLQLKIRTGSLQPPKVTTGRLNLQRIFQRSFEAEMTVDGEDVIGEIAPFIYGTMLEHVEDAVYGGAFTADGEVIRADVLELTKALRPPVIRFPGGRFASGYHWEEALGPKNARMPKFNPAWNEWNSNHVGTHEFMDFCRETGASPYLVVNDGSGSPEEAANWVAYCNTEISGGFLPSAYSDPFHYQAYRRAENGHEEPYNVRLWGVGNEVWGQWQIGNTDAHSYVKRLIEFAECMRQPDPEIGIVAAGDAVLSDDPSDPARLWNETVLRDAGEAIDGLSFHLFQPGMSGWQESYDPEALYHAVCAAPLSAEDAVRRMAAQIHEISPAHDISVVLDEWNLFMPPPEGASSLHKQAYTLRDALYAAGMLNAFHRQCRSLAVANVAQLVNVIPLIYANKQGAFATPLYYPLQMYRNHMEKVALNTRVSSPAYDSPALGNINAKSQVPYIDVTVTRSRDSSRLVLGIINRHPTQRAHLSILLGHLPALHPTKAWLLSGPDPSAANSFANPDSVRTREADLPTLRGDSLVLDLPPASLYMAALQQRPA